MIKLFLILMVFPMKSILKGLKLYYRQVSGSRDLAFTFIFILMSFSSMYKSKINVNSIFFHLHYINKLSLHSSQHPPVNLSLPQILSPAGLGTFFISMPYASLSPFFLHN